jgi:hypothetical protein
MILMDLRNRPDVRAPVPPATVRAGGESAGRSRRGDSSSVGANLPINGSFRGVVSTSHTVFRPQTRALSATRLG